MRILEDTRPASSSLGGLHKDWRKPNHVMSSSGTNTEKRAEDRSSLLLLQEQGEMQMRG